LDRIDVSVGPTANINGDLVCDGIVKIEGIYQGSIKTVSNVIITEKAKVDAHIEAENVSVSGQAKGSIVAKGRLEILTTGRVWADVTVSSFLLDDGGKLHGALKMFGTGAAPKSFEVPAVPKAVTTLEELEEQEAAADTEEPAPSEES
jgi:cytoskeletal protein CcmA (bactofilin family)